MKRILLLAILLCGLTAYAQTTEAKARSLAATDGCWPIPMRQLPSVQSLSMPSATTVNLNLPKAEKDKKVGTGLLIAAGCCLAAGAISYGCGFSMVSDAGSYFTIAGISAMGISIPLFISGSVLYVRGKKEVRN